MYTIVCVTTYTAVIRLVYAIYVYFKCAPSVYYNCTLVFYTCCPLGDILVLSLVILRRVYFLRNYTPIVYMMLFPHFIIMKMHNSSLHAICTIIIIIIL